MNYKFIIYLSKNKTNKVCFLRCLQDLYINKKNSTSNSKQLEIQNHKEN